MHVGQPQDSRRQKRWWVPQKTAFEEMTVRVDARHERGHGIGQRRTTAGTITTKHTGHAHRLHEDHDSDNEMVDAEMERRGREGGRGREGEKGGWV
jgi:hypothetical protein